MTFFAGDLKKTENIVSGQGLLYRRYGSICHVSYNTNPTQTPIGGRPGSVIGERKAP